MSRTRHGPPHGYIGTQSDVSIRQDTVPGQRAGTPSSPCNPLWNDKMGKVLYVWELGADYGHVSNFLPLAGQLRRQGHEIILAIKDLSRIQSLPGASEFDIMQAPIWLPQVTGLPQPQVCYAEILHRFGYLNYVGLLGMVKAWRMLYALIQPDLVIADHAPTALLAARELPFARALYGNGFFSPPRISPLPSMRPWLNVPTQRLENSEHAALRIINQVLAELHLSPLENLAALFAVDADFLMTTRELDHYPNRGAADYVGPVLSVPGGVTPDWPAAPGPKLFAYVKPQYQHFKRLLAQLRDAPCAILMHAPGLSETRRNALQAPNLHISPLPVDIRYACRQADALLCHAGHGTIMQSLMAGVPLLLLPTHLEQSLNARNVVRLGAGLAVNPEQKEPDFAGRLQELLGRHEIAEKARAFAQRYADVDQERMMATVAARCAELIAPGGRLRLRPGAG